MGIGQKELYKSILFYHQSPESIKTGNGVPQTPSTSVSSRNTYELLFKPCWKTSVSSKFLTANASHSHSVQST